MLLFCLFFHKAVPLFIHLVPCYVSLRFLFLSSQPEDVLIEINIKRCNYAKSLHGLFIHQHEQIHPTMIVFLWYTFSYI